MSNLKTLSLYSKVDNLPLNIKSDINLFNEKVIKINGVTVLTSSQIFGKNLPSSEMVGVDDTQILANKTLSDFNLNGNINANKNIIFNLINNSASISFDSLNKKNILQIDTTLDNEKVKINSNMEIEANLNVKANMTIGANLVINGNIVVNGETTVIQSSTLQVNDKNIELGYSDSRVDSLIDGGGLTLKGETDKTFNWINSSKSWTSSENINLVSNKKYYINDIMVLSTDQILGAITRKNITLNINAIISIKDIFEFQKSGQYNFFDIDDPRLGGIIYLKDNLDNEPDVRVDSNGNFVSIVKNTDSKLNIFIQTNLVYFENKTNKIINLTVYKKT